MVRPHDEGAGRIRSHRHLLLHPRAERHTGSPHQSAAAGGGVRRVLRDNAAPLCMILELRRERDLLLPILKVALTQRFMAADLVQYAPCTEKPMAISRPLRLICLTEQERASCVTFQL